MQMQKSGLWCSRRLWGGTRGGFSRRWVRGFAARCGGRRRSFNTQSALSKTEEAAGLRIWYSQLRVLIRGAEWYGSKYGRFPPVARFNMDETAIGFWQARNAIYTTKEERTGTGRIRKMGRRGRFGSAVATLHQGRQVMPLLLWFKGTGEGLTWESHLEMSATAAYHAIQYRFNKRAWMNQRVLVTWFQETFLPAARAIVPAPQEILLMMDIFGDVHRSAELLELAASEGAVIACGPPNLTGRWQPLDAAVLKCFKDKFAEELRAWRKRGRNARLFRSGRWTAQMQRVAALKFASRAWRSVHDLDQEQMHWAAWNKTGRAMTADGSGDCNIRPQGHNSYAPPTPPGGRAADPDEID